MNNRDTKPTRQRKIKQRLEHLANQAKDRERKNRKWALLNKVVVTVGH